MPSDQRVITAESGAPGHKALCHPQRRLSGAASTAAPPFSTGIHTKWDATHACSATLRHLRPRYVVTVVSALARVVYIHAGQQQASVTPSMHTCMHAPVTTANTLGTAQTTSGSCAPAQSLKIPGFVTKSGEYPRWAERLCVCCCFPDRFESSVHSLFVACLYR